MIPQALGCPDHSVLRDGQVCGACNHGFGPIDQALIDSFDLLRLAYNVAGRRSRIPRITSRRNLRTVTLDGVTGHMYNPGPANLFLPNGQVIPGPNRSTNSVWASVHGHGSSTSLTLRTGAWTHPKFGRAVHKIAIESIALLIGRRAALHPNLRTAKAYAQCGAGGSREVLATPVDPPTYTNQPQVVYYSDHNQFLGSPLIGGVYFLVDCSPDQTLLPLLKEVLFRDCGPAGWWTIRQ